MTATFARRAWASSAAARDASASPRAALATQATLAQSLQAHDATPLFPSHAPREEARTIADDPVRFKNDQGLAEIGIGVTEFKCIGASPPHDHPHIYHTIGEQGFVHCLYCNTKYVYRPDLDRTETAPPGNVFEDEGTDKFVGSLSAMHRSGINPPIPR